MKKLNIILLAILLPLAMIAIVVMASVWSGKHLAEFGYEETSPKRYYRVEIWNASPLSFLTWEYENPVFIKFYDNRSGKLLAETEILDIRSDGKIYWPSSVVPEIMVGVTASVPAEPEPE